MNNINKIYEVEVLVKDKPIKKFSKDNRVYIEARDNTEYKIKLKNNSYTRVLAVVTCDGLNVIDGKAGGATKNGYILNGLSSLEIKGWRTSNDIVNAFKFSNKKNSYSANSKETNFSTENVGVIGVQFYSEKIEYKPLYINNQGLEGWPNVVEIIPDKTPYYPYPKNKPYWGNDSLCRSFQSRQDYSENDITYSCCLNNSTPNFDMGTEFSNKEISDSVKEVEFNIGNLIFSTEIYYASRKSLENIGIQFEKETQVTFPNPFPNKFCKPPTKYRC